MTERELMHLYENLLLNYEVSFHCVQIASWPNSTPMQIVNNKIDTVVARNECNQECGTRIMKYKNVLTVRRKRRRRKQKRKKNDEDKKAFADFNKFKRKL